MPDKLAMTVTNLYSGHNFLCDLDVVLRFRHAEHARLLPPDIREELLREHGSGYYKNTGRWLQRPAPAVPHAASSFVCVIEFGSSFLEGSR